MCTRSWLLNTEIDGNVLNTWFNYPIKLLFISNLITNYLHYVIFDTGSLKSKILEQSSTLVNEITSDDEGLCYITR